MDAAATSAVQGLLRRFRSQKPLRGGSLLITVFGDSLAPRGGVVTLGGLIALASPFGLTERLVRTSVARLAQDDWLAARRDGRRSEYGLTPNGRQRFAEATRRIYGAAPASWDGHWTVLLLPANGAPRRDSVREGLRWLGFGQISPGFFMHPNSDADEVRTWLQSIDAPVDVMLLKASSADLGVDRALVASGWDLAELGRRYRRFVDSFSVLSGRAASRPWSPEAAFVIRTLLIHEYRKIHLRDPLLPPPLLPDNWVGSAAYSLCATLYASVFKAAEEFLTATAATFEGQLPPAEPSAYARFGGIGR